MSNNCDVAKNNKKVYMHVAIMFIIGAVISSLPPFGQITPMGMDVLAVFVMLIYGWLAIDLVWTSLLGFFLLALTQATTVTGALTTCFSNQTVITILVVVALANGMDELGIGDAITNYMLSRKFIMGRPWVLITMIVTLAFLLSIFNQGMIGCILLWSVMSGILKTCGYEEQGSLMGFLLCMIFFACMLPMYIVPWHPMIFMFSSFFQTGTQLVHPMGAYFIWGLVLYAAVFIIMLLLGRFVFRIDASKLDFSEELRQEYASKKISKTTKYAMVALAIFILVLLLPEFFPELPGMAAAKNIGLLGWSIVYMAVFGLWRNEETGKPALNIQKAFASVPWSIVFVMGVTLPLGSALGSADVGVMPTITQMVAPLTSNFGVTGFYIFCFVLLGVATQVLHNMVLGIVFLPLFGSIGVSMGCNPYILFFLMFIALNTAYATPAGCGNCGMLFGNTQIKKTHCYMWGTILIVVTLIVGSVMIPLMKMMS